MLEKYTASSRTRCGSWPTASGVDLDAVRFEYELGACTKDVDLGWYLLPRGSLGGCYLKYIGAVGGVPQIEMHLEWQMTPFTDPHWEIQACYITKIDADPASTAST